VQAGKKRNDRGKRREIHVVGSGENDKRGKRPLQNMLWGANAG